MTYSLKLSITPAQLRLCKVAIVHLIWGKFQADASLEPQSRAAKIINPTNLRIIIIAFLFFNLYAHLIIGVSLFKRTRYCTLRIAQLADCLIRSWSRALQHCCTNNPKRASSAPISTPIRAAGIPRRCRKIGAGGDPAGSPARWRRERLEMVIRV